MKNKWIWIVVVIVIVVLSVINYQNNSSKSGEKIKIGVILPLTGPAASITNDLQKSLRMYEKQAKNIEMVLQDDQCTGKGAISAYNIMKNNGVKVYIVACSGSILALAPIIKEDGNLIVTGFGGSIAIRETGDEVIRFIPDGLSIAEGVIDLIKSTPEKKFALFHEQQDYPQSVADKLVEAVGNQIVLRETYKGDDTSFKTQILKLKNSEADTIIFIPVSEGTSQVIYKEMRDLGLSKEILGEVNVCDHATPPSDFGLHGYCFTTVLETEGYKKYLADYNTEYQKEPLYPFYNAITYDVFVALDNLFEGVGRVDNRTIRKIKDQILDGVEGIITSYEFSPDGEVTSGDYLKRVDF